MSRPTGRRWSAWVSIVFVCFLVLDATVLAFFRHYDKATFRLATALLIMALDGWNPR